jgi:hypothetical protein
MRTQGSMLPKTLRSPNQIVNRKLGIIAVPFAAIACAASGYAIGTATAPTADDAAAATSKAHEEALVESRSGAHDEALDRGLRAGAEAGRQAGKAAGREEGTGAGSSSADAELAAAEAAERAANCGAPLFVTGYCPSDEEIAAENQAESLCGSANYEEAAAQGIDCGPGTSPRP